MNTNHTARFTTFVPRTSLTWCTWHCHHAADPDFIPPEMRPSNSPDLNPVDYSIWGYPSREGLPFAYRSRIHDVKELKERLLREWRLLDHIIIVAVIVQWCSHLNACVHGNGGHSEHKFWASDFLLCFFFVSSTLVSVNVIDINMCKVLILCEMCYFCVWYSHTVW